MSDQLCERFFYSAKGEEARLKSDYDSKTVIQGLPKLVHLESANVFAGGSALSCGVLDRAGQARPLSMLRWGNRMVYGGPKKLEQHAAGATVRHRLAGRSLYIGHIRPHFGHFLLEGLSRLWPLLRGDAYDNFVLVDPGDGLELAAYQRKMLSKFLDVDKITVVSRDCIACDSLEVPEAAWVFNVKAHAVMRDVFQYVRTAFGADDDKLGDQTLFLSRSKVRASMSGSTRLIGEEIIEQQVEAAGGLIVHPQDLSFEEQVTLVNRHKTVISFAGSAAHLLLMGAPGQSAYLYRTGPFGDYSLQAHLRTDQEYHFVGLRAFNRPDWLRIKGEYSACPVVAPRYFYLQQILKDQGVVSGSPIFQNGDTVYRQYLDAYIDDLLKDYRADPNLFSAAELKALRVLLSAIDEASAPTPSEQD